MKETKLNDGTVIPSIGFGVFLIPNDGSTYRAVRTALDAGYRHIDTAAAYFNESEVGKAVKDSGISRQDIFVTSKLWLQDYGYEMAKKGLETSLDNLGLEYVDLYLLHQPYGDVEGAWKALEEAKKEGKVRSIGVSNMTVNIWNHFVPHFDTLPSINQVEMNPFFQQKELRSLLEKDDVRLEAYQPLGHGNKDLLENETITGIAKAHGKTNAQVILNYLVSLGAIVLPKSTNEERIKSNLDIYGFELSREEMAAMASLDKGVGSHDPEAPGVGEMLLKNYRVHD